MNKDIIFVTHNLGKTKSAEIYFKNIKFSTFNYELDEFTSFYDKVFKSTNL